MIVVNVRFELEAAELEGIRDAVAAMERASRAEQGCLDYTFSVELNDPRGVRITERWVDAEALQAHFRTPHMAEFRQAIAGVERRALESSFWQAEEIERP